MRWKLLVGLAITWFGLGITGLFQHAGIIPLYTPLRGRSALAMESVQVKIDLVTQRPDGGCTLVLIETGPWIGEQKKQNMQRLANRIAGCVSASINGHIARRYPATMGVPLT